MGLFDIFSTSFLITIGITVLALCLMFLYFSQKFAEQDHKISSMVDLVTTMAQEIHMLKIQGHQQEAQYPSDLATNGGSTLVTKKENQLIEVSDDEDEEEEEYESDSDNDSDNDSNNESDEEVDNEYINDDTEPLTLEEEINLDDIQELEENENEEVKNVSITLDTLDEIKTISLQEEEQDVHHIDTDYKKMSVDKLRHIVVEKGLVVDASKLKKKELLKLLGLSE